jgi:hypothetical protein
MRARSINLIIKELNVNYTSDRMKQIEIIYNFFPKAENRHDWD